MVTADRMVPDRLLLVKAVSTRSRYTDQRIQIGLRVVNNAHPVAPGEQVCRVESVFPFLPAIFQRPKSQSPKHMKGNGVSASLTMIPTSMTKS